MDFLSFVKNARTCRRFAEDKPLQMQDLEWLISCARFTPSARNAQLVRFVAVCGQMCTRVFPHTHWAMALKDWKGPYEGERPTAFLALLLPKDASELAFVDLGIVAQTIQLAAHSRAWGTCIIKSFDEAKVAQVLNIPEGMKISLVLGLGVAVEKRVAIDAKEGSLGYFRDTEGTHFVPKRTLDELIVGRFADC